MVDAALGRDSHAIHGRGRLDVGLRHRTGWRLARRRTRRPQVARPRPWGGYTGACLLAISKFPPSRKTALTLSRKRYPSLPAFALPRFYWRDNDTRLTRCWVRKCALFYRHAKYHRRG